MEEPSSSTSPPSEPSKEIDGESNDDKGEEAMEVVKDDKACPATLLIKNFDDENEETVLMTIEEAQNYILSKVETYIRDPTMNPLLILKDQITSLHDKIQSKREEFFKLNRMFDALYRDQVKFLMHIGVMAKVETKTVGVSVDLPWLPDSVPGLINEDVLKSSADKVFLQPTNGTVPRLPKKEPSGPIECIDLTDDEDVTPVSTPASSSPAPKPATTTADSTESSSSSPSVPAKNIPSTSVVKKNVLQHPAPLPSVPDANDREVPPKPRLKISADRNDTFNETNTLENSSFSEPADPSIRAQKNHRAQKNRSFYVKCDFCGAKKDNSPGVTFHRFPRNPKRSNRWARSLGVEYIINASPEERYSRFRVCSNHFRVPQYLNLLKKRLYPSAIPENIDIPKIRSSLRKRLSGSGMTNEIVAGSSTYANEGSTMSSGIEGEIPPGRLHLIQALKKKMKLSCYNPQNQENTVP